MTHMPIDQTSMTQSPQESTRTPSPSASGNNAAAIATRALFMSFGRSHAIEDLDLDIPHGAIYALIGPNGAGKTTLIKLLLNILRPTSGTATVLGRPSTSIAGAALQRIAYVSENQEMPEWMTIPHLLEFLRPFYPTWDRALEQHLLRQFDLPVTRKLKHLSRGQRMKAALLSVLPFRPSLIVLDEPFSGLDPLVRDEFIEGLLDQLAEAQNAPTVLISSHDLAEIESFATHIGFLDRGRLLLSEEIVTLTNRFREVTVTLDPNTIPAQGRSAGTPTQPAPPFPSWLLPERSGHVFRFIHSSADTEPIHDQVASIHANAASVEIEPMSLRAIFLALARSARNAPTAQTGIRSRA